MAANASLHLQLKFMDMKLFSAKFTSSWNFCQVPTFTANVHMHYVRTVST